MRFKKQEPSPFPKRKRQGFRMVVRILVGVTLGSVGLAILGPVFWGQRYQGACGCAQEGPGEMGAMLRGQQAHFLATNQFSESIESLGLGLPKTSQKYHYKVAKQANAVIHYAIPILPDQKGSSEHSEQRKKANFVGGVFLVADPDNPQEVKTEVIICQGQRGDYRLPPKPILENNKPTCPAEYTELGS